MEQQVIEEGSLWKIREMYLSEDSEGKDIAYRWLCKMVGEKDAKANLFVLSFYKDWDDDSDCIIDDDNWWKMKFTTYRIWFGKDYRYNVYMSAKFEGEVILKIANSYSRYQVGNGDPKWDFCDYLCQEFRKRGHTFYDGIFVNKTK